MQRAKFSKNLADQVAAFKSSGFVLIKPLNTTSATDRIELQAANTYILRHLHDERSSWRYKLWRAWNQVASSDKRHSLPLPLVAAIKTILTRTVGDIRPFLDSQLPICSELVELNSLVSMPGSLEQDVHADIPFSSDNVLISGFIALADVNLIDGPTYLHAGSHAQSFHNSISIASSSTYYSSDGSVEYTEEEQPHTPTTASGSTGNTTAEGVKASPQITPACYAQLKAGDVLLFNTMVFHYGGANTSSVPRALLSFSFQRNATDGSMSPIDGFTYHCHSSVKGRYTLGSFPHSVIRNAI